MWERAWPPPVSDKWFAGLLSQQVVQVLGKPVFLPCVAAGQNRAGLEGVATQVQLRAHAQHELNPCSLRKKPPLAQVAALPPGAGKPLAAGLA